MFATFDLAAVGAAQQQRIVERFAKSRSVDIRITDNPLSSVWRALQRYSGLQRARKLFSDQTEADIAEFCAYIEIADAYSAVAEDAAVILDPLLLYYASMWLSRALIASRLGIDIAKTIKAHGSKPKPQSSGGLNMLGGSTTIHRKGTIPSLVVALGGADKIEAELQLLDLIKAIPEMNDVLKDVLGASTTALAVQDRSAESGFNTGQINVQLPHHVTLSEVARLPIAPALHARGAQISTFSPHTILWRTQSSSDDEMSTLFIRTAAGYFAETTVGGVYIPQIAIYVLLLHALSEFSRYYPREWLNIHSEHDSDYALIREFYSVAEQKVPALILNELAQESLFYTHA